MELRDAVVIVTGAAGGIGAATVAELRRHGSIVVAADIDQPALAGIVDTDRVTTVVCDVRDPAHADALVARTREAHGRLDIVIANAGIGHAGEFADMSADRIDALVDVNVRAPLQLARAALPDLRQQAAGALVFVTSIAGVMPVQNEAVYSATKAAVEAFAEALRAEETGSGVTVQTVLPSVVDTSFFARRGVAYDRRFPRPLPPEKVARAIVAAIKNGQEQVVVPGWVGIPIRVRSIAPGFFRAMARRFG